MGKTQSNRSVEAAGSDGIDGDLLLLPVVDRQGKFTP